MRVIAGTARSIPLFGVKATTTRPMTDRVKTSLFSILNPRLPGAVVIDLFAGTGTQGIEALSRGAAGCTFIERDPACIRMLARNLERTHLEENATVLKYDAWSAVRDLAERGFSADMVLFDPPFRMGKALERQRLLKLVGMLCEGPLAQGGLLVYHHESDTDGELAVEGLEVTDQRKYSRNIVTFLTRR